MSSWSVSIHFGIFYLVTDLQRMGAVSGLDVLSFIGVCDLALDTRRELLHLDLQGGLQVRIEFNSGFALLYAA
jgi:hypothetical protein